IITTPITFSATAAAAYYVGARVVIADVDPRSGNLTAEAVEPRITSRTRAIVPVHLGGLPADLDELRDLARRRGLLLIEDACHAPGATSTPPSTGAGDSPAIVYSSHPVKHIPPGEGGAIATPHAHVKRRIDRLRHHGIERTPATGPWLYEVV